MDEERFFSLLRQYNELKKLDHEEGDMLLNSIKTIRNNFYLSERQEYINLAKDFLADQMTADDFSYAFMDAYEGITREVGQMKEDESLELVNLLKPEESSELGDLLSKTYGTCDFFGHGISDEKELKDCAQILLLKLQ
jgi:hypothetical protein